MLEPLNPMTSFLGLLRSIRKVPSSLKVVTWSGGVTKSCDKLASTKASFYGTMPISKVYHIVY